MIETTTTNDSIIDKPFVIDYIKILEIVVLLILLPDLVAQLRRVVRIQILNNKP